MDEPIFGLDLKQVSYLTSFLLLKILVEWPQDIQELILLKVEVTLGIIIRYG